MKFREVLALPLLLAVAACEEAASSDSAAQAPIVRTVLVSTAASDTHSYTGVVRARVESGLGFRVAGKIIARSVDVGQTVRSGQVLARLDTTDFALGAATASAQAQAAVDQAEAASRQVGAAQAAATRAAADERRLRGLVSAGAVSAQAYDQARAASQAAAADLAAVQAQADASRSSAAAARTSARQAGNQAEYGVLRSDVDGVVVEVLAEPGQVVSPGQTVIRVARSGAREAVVAVPEARRARVARTAAASLYSDPGPAFPALLRELSASADPLTRTFQARYVLGGRGSAAPIGSTVTIRTANGAGGAGSAVPVGAIIERGGGPGVWVVDPRTLRVAFRRVTIAALGEEEVRLVSGVTEGERIVALGAHLLKPGQTVRLASRTGTGTEQ
jgi:multidrug efflux pump subunit AcrA (membrane-fusion protein)